MNRAGSNFPCFGPRLSLAAWPLALLALCGCTRVPPSNAAVPVIRELRGEIVEIRPARHTVLVHHEEIPGYMPSMTMEFSAPGADLASFHEGQHISARLVEGPPGEFRLEGIRTPDPLKERAVAAATQSLRQDTLIRGKRAYREIGETAPDFALFNQEGDVVTFNHFRGKRVVLNFIFTRCPVATMCPAATAKMAALQRLARERGITDLELVSVSLDPAYDTPAVLKAYAAARGIDPANFNFLTGPEAAVRDLFVQFGIIVEPSANIWKHTLSTLVIDRNGRIVDRIDGSTWDPADILQRLL